jgi:hypothetical protein
MEDENTDAARSYSFVSTGFLLKERLYFGARGLTNYSALVMIGDLVASLVVCLLLELLECFWCDCCLN